MEIITIVLMQFGQVLYRNFLLLVARRILFYAEKIVFPYSDNESDYITCPACEEKMLFKTFKKVQKDNTCPHCGYKIKREDYGFRRTRSY